MTRPVKVLLVCKGLGLGGMERLLASSIPYLDRDEFDYEIAYFLPWKDDLVPEFVSAGIPVHCLDIGKSLDPRAVPRLRRLLIEKEIELVHTHSPHPAAVARIASRFTPVRALVHTEHSLPESRKAISHLANRVTHPLNDLTIAVSGEVGGSVDQSGVFSPRNLRVIHGGIDIEAIEKAASEPSTVSIPAGRMVVGNVAHLRAQKGLDTFVQAAANIAEERPDTHFVIVGREKQAGYQRELELLASSLGLGDRITFTGFQMNPYPILGSFDVFMLSSRHEGFPVAVLEAMSLARPVVAPTVGGIPEAITDSVDGLLVPPGDPEALAAATLRLLADPEMRSRLGANARATVLANFTVEGMVREVEDAYREAVSGSAR